MTQTTLMVGVSAMALWAVMAQAATTKTCLTGNDPSVSGDKAQIVALRAQIDSACPCANFDGSKGKAHSDYVKCAAAIITAQAAVPPGNLRTQCKATVKTFYMRSTCGRSPNLHTEPCIQTSLKTGKITCTIKPTTKLNGVTPTNVCATTAKLSRVACPASSQCIEAADTNGDQIIAAPGDTGACVPALCGNGVVDPGEDCDPGLDPPPNDGCGAPGTANQCTFIPAPAGEDQCPGQAIAVPVGTTILPASNGMSTYGFTDDYIASGACLNPYGATTGGLDRVFQLTPATSGAMTVSVGFEADGVTSSCAASQSAPKCWARVLYARTACATATSEIACAVGVDLATANFIPASISFAVTANTPYWVIVDGYDGNTYSYGPFNLIVKLQ